MVNTLPTRGHHSSGQWHEQHSKYELEKRQGTYHKIHALSRALYRARQIAFGHLSNIPLESLQSLNENASDTFRVDRVDRMHCVPFNQRPGAESRPLRLS